MSNDVKAPREFWINDIDSPEPTIFTKLQVSKFRKDFNNTGEYIHVIEYSAFEAAHERISQLQVTCGDLTDRLDKAKNEIEQLKDWLGE